MVVYVVYRPAAAAADAGSGVDGLWGKVRLCTLCTDLPQLLLMQELEWIMEE